MLHIAIVEDNPGQARLLQEYLERFFAEVGQDAELTHFSSGDTLLNDYRPVWDILLMDIELPGRDGMSVAARIRELDQRVVLIFITQMAQYAIRGYEVNALDYVLKPVSYYAFTLKLNKALRVLRERQSKQIMLQGENGLQVLSTDQLYYVEVWGHKLCYHTSLGDFTATGARTLQEVEDELGGLGFLRCNQSCLVNFRYVQRIGKDEVQVNDQCLAISRGRRKAFLEGMSRYLGGGRPL